MGEARVYVIYGNTKLIEGVGRVDIIFLRGTRFIINNVLFSTRSKKGLLSFQDIRIKGIILR